MTNLRWVINFVLPIGLIIYGFLYKHVAYKKIGIILGYKTAAAKMSQDTWEYANKRVGDMWMKYGVYYTIFVGLFLLISKSAREKLSIVVFAVGLFIILYTFSLVDKELKEKFDEKGEPR